MLSSVCSVTVWSVTVLEALSEELEALFAFFFTVLVFCTSEVLSSEAVFDLFTFDLVFFEEEEALLPDEAEALLLLPFELSS